MFIKGKRIHIAWVGCGTLNSGYGASNAGILKAMASSRIVVHDPEDMSCEVGVAYMPLDSNPIEAIRQPVRVLYTMFEATRWPDAWVSQANCAHEVWVPSKWCRETLIASGCDRPVRIIPLGIDPESFFPGKQQAKAREFVIGFAGAAVGRKGIDLLIEAFQEEFASDEPVELRVRTSNYLPSTFPDGDDRIKIDGGIVSIAAMRDFYLSCDLLALPSRGEGFGLTAIEAMACGTPVAVTDFGGSKDYLADDTLKIAVGIAQCSDYLDCQGYWAKPSMQSLRYCLRWAFENRARVKDMGLTAAKRIAEGWTFGHTAESMTVALCQLDTRERIELASERVVVWRGDPQKVNTAAGPFMRGTPRVLTDEAIALLNPSDVHANGFLIRNRYIRSAPTADKRRQSK